MNTSRAKMLHGSAGPAPLPPASHVSRGDFYWLRLVITPLCWVLFGLVTLVLSVAVLPLLRLLSFGGPRSRRLARAIIAAGLRFFVALIATLRMITYSFEGREKLGRPGQLIVANHPTLIDVVFMLGFVPTSNCIVKTALFGNLITSGAVRAAGYIRNAPTDEMIHESERQLVAGETLLIFPEGTRTVPGRPLQLQRGAANVALRGARVLTPVFISVDPPMLSKRLPWYRIPLRRAHYRIRVGDDINLQPYRELPLPRGSRKLNEDLAGLFARPNPVRD